MRVLWMRTHVPVRNAKGGISCSFFEPEYEIDLRDRVFYISKCGAFVTSTPIENCVEFTPDGDSKETEAPAPKARRTNKVQA